MKKRYTDPLMFSNVLLSGVVVGPSQQGGFGPKSAPEALLDETIEPDLSITTDAEESLVPASGSDIEIVDPAPAVDSVITEESVQSVLDQIVPEETSESPAADTTDIAE